MELEFLQGEGQLWPRQINAFYNPDNIPIKVALSHHCSSRVTHAEADGDFIEHFQVQPGNGT